MSSKESILQSIRSHTLDVFPMPDLSPLEEQAIHYADPEAQFKLVMQQVGGKAVTLAEGETLGAFVHSLYPEAKRVAWAVDRTDGCDVLGTSVFDPDNVEQPAELNGTDVAVIPAQLGVCENGCCWIEQHVRHRALYFISETLVIVLDRKALVHNMHEAYARIADRPEVPFAGFISGPSKTADIEQALVFGAHGAREVTVVLV